MPPVKLLFPVWSGTGNTLQVARWAMEEAAGHGGTSALFPISKKTPPPAIPTESGHILALALPTHGFTAPWPVVRFLLSLPRSRGAQALALITRGGSWLGFPLPGFAGSAPWLTALLLRLKGYRMRGVLRVDMPQNWTALFPGLHPKHCDPMFLRAKTKTRAFIRAVFKDSRPPRPPATLLEGLGGLLLLPISLLYLLLGHFYLAKLFFTTESCTGCGLCARHCPQQAILMRGKPNRQRPYWTFACASCGRCINYCPHQAIQSGHTILALLLWVTTLPLSLWLFKGLMAAGAPPPPEGMAGFLLELPIKLLAIWLAALLLDPLLRLPLLNRLFTLTAPTRWFRRYHMPRVSLKDLESEPKNTPS